MKAPVYGSDRIVNPEFLNIAGKLAEGSSNYLSV